MVRERERERDSHPLRTLRPPGLGRGGSKRQAVFISPFSLVVRVQSRFCPARGGAGVAFVNTQTLEGVYI